MGKYHSGRKSLKSMRSGEMIAQSENERILLLGAAGWTGCFALEHALSKGYEVNALVQKGDEIPFHSRHLFLINGTPDNMGDLSRAISGCVCVLSTINNVPSEFKNLIQRYPPLFVSNSIKNCLEVMGEARVRRIVVMSAFGVGDSFKYAPPVLRFLMTQTDLRTTYEDLELQEGLLRKSQIDWTIVRPVGFTNDTSVKKMNIGNGENLRAAAKIGRKSVGTFMVDCLKDDLTIGKTLVVSDKPANKRTEGYL